MPRCRLGESVRCVPAVCCSYCGRFIDARDGSEEMIKEVKFRGFPAEDLRCCSMLLKIALTYISRPCFYRSVICCGFVESA